MAGEVFISYVHEDKNLAHKIRDALEAQGISCWIASHNIQTGTNWTASIMEAINQSHLMLFILSANSNNASKEVLRELQCADTRDLPIISLSVGGISPVAGVEYFLSTQQLLEIALPPTEAQLDAVAKAAQFHLSFQEIYKRKYAAAEGLIRKRYWAQCVVQCLDIFESAMKYLLKGLVNSLQDSRTKKAILATEKTILGKVPRGRPPPVFEDFTLPQMIRLFNEAKLFPELKKQLCDPLYRTTTSTNWPKLEVLWYQTKDPSGVTTCGEDDARDVAFWAKNLLYESKILGVGIRQEKTAMLTKPLNVCGSCNSHTMEDWHFCPQCGASLKLECMACHKALQVEWRRCPYCDSPVRKAHETSADNHKHEDEYRTLSRGAWLDGVVSIRERRLLDEKRLELGLGSDVADRIERECAPPNVIEYSRFVEGVLVDGVITDIEREFLDKKALQIGIDPWVAKQTEETLLATTVR